MAENGLNIVSRRHLELGKGPIKVQKASGMSKNAKIHFTN